MSEKLCNIKKNGAFGGTIDLTSITRILNGNGDTVTVSNATNYKILVFKATINNSNVTSNITCDDSNYKSFNGKMTGVCVCIPSASSVKFTVAWGTGQGTHTYEVYAT